MLCRRSPAQWSLLTLLAVDKTNKRLEETLRTVFTSVLHLEPRLSLEQLTTVLGWQTTNGANIHFPPGYGRGVGVFPIQAFLNHDCRYVIPLIVVLTDDWQEQH